MPRLALSANSSAQHAKIAAGPDYISTPPSRVQAIKIPLSRRAGMNVRAQNKIVRFSAMLVTIGTPPVQRANSSSRFVSASIALHRI
jgi:hypothetical protein